MQPHAARAARPGRRTDTLHTHALARRRETCSTALRTRLSATPVSPTHRPLAPFAQPFGFPATRTALSRDTSASPLSLSSLSGPGAPCAAVLCVVPSLTSTPRAHLSPRACASLSHHACVASSAPSPAKAHKGREGEGQRVWARLAGGTVKGLWLCEGMWLWVAGGPPSSEKLSSQRECCSISPLT